MKTKVILAAALLLSTATFSQHVSTRSEQATKVHSTATSGEQPGATASGSSTVTSNTSVKTNALSKAETKAASTKQESTEMVATQKEVLTNEAKTDVELARKTAGKTREVSSKVNSETEIVAENNVDNNKFSKNASLSSQSLVSSEGFKSTNKKQEGVVMVNNGAFSALETGYHVKAATYRGMNKSGKRLNTRANAFHDEFSATANTSCRTAVKAGGGNKNFVKPAPAFASVRTQVKGNAGLKIR